MGTRRLVDFRGEPLSPRERRRVLAELDRDSQLLGIGADAPSPRKRWYAQHCLIVTVFVATWLLAFAAIWA
jgi:hypothetical protein